MKTPVTSLAPLTLVASAVVPKILPRHHEQLFPDYAPGSPLIQDPNLVIGDGRVIWRDPDLNV